MIEKECEACGKFYMATRKTQKYCPDCGKNGPKIKQYIDNRIRYQTMAENREKLTERTCKYCGKTYLAPGYSVKKFCSDDCEEKYKKSTLMCAYCGKPVILDHEPTKQEYSRPARAYCNETCRQKAKQKELIERYGIRNCAWCGKEFISSNKKFCSRKCSAEYEWAHRDKTQKVCLNCGKTYSSQNSKFCSKACYDEYHKTHPYPTRPANQTRTAKTKNDKLETYIKQNGMCSICRTSYIDCERMRSNFRYSPNGAVFDKDKVIKCPKFTPPKKI